MCTQSCISKFFFFVKESKSNVDCFSLFFRILRVKVINSSKLVVTFTNFTHNVAV